MPTASISASAQETQWRFVATEELRNEIKNFAEYFDLVTFWSRDSKIVKLEFFTHEINQSRLKLDPGSYEDISTFQGKEKSYLESMEHLLLALETLDTTRTESAMIKIHEIIESYRKNLRYVTPLGDYINLAIYRISTVITHYDLEWEFSGDIRKIMPKFNDEKSYSKMSPEEFFQDLSSLYHTSKPLIERINREYIEDRPNVSDDFIHPSIKALEEVRINLEKIDAALLLR